MPVIKLFVSAKAASAACLAATRRRRGAHHLAMVEEVGVGVDYAAITPGGLAADIAADMSERQRRRKVREPMQRSERVSAETTAAILGLPLRTVQGLAARGKLTAAGAAKLGRRWTFDLEKLRRHVKDKERQAWQRANAEHHPDATGGAITYGAALGSTGETSAGRFTQVIRRLRGRGTPPARRG